MVSVVAKVLAKAQGELPIADLRSFHSAQSDIHSLANQLTLDRIRLSGAHRDVLDYPKGDQLAAAYSWHAQVLYAIGKAQLDADALLDPKTVGFAPKAMCQFVSIISEQIPPVIDRAYRARNAAEPVIEGEPGMSITWPDSVGSSPREAHCEMAMTDAIVERFHALLGDYEPLLPPRASWSVGLNQTIQSAVSLHEQLRAQFPAGYSIEDPNLALRVARHIVDLYDIAGQMLVAPSLTFAIPASAQNSGLDSPKDHSPSPSGTASSLHPNRNVFPAPASTPTTPMPPAAPRQIDPWFFTESTQRSQRSTDERCISEIYEYNQRDGNKQNTALLAEGLAMLARRNGIVPVQGGPLSMFVLSCDDCPWAPIYEAREPLFLQGLVIGPRQQFTVMWKALTEEHSFLEVVVGDFEPV
jgi:hypothetical protein